MGEAPMKQWIVAIMAVAFAAALSMNAHARKTSSKPPPDTPPADKPDTQAMWDKMDSDRDGSVTLAEFQQAKGADNEVAKQNAKQMFEKMDKDSDKSITRAEFDEWSKGYLSPDAKPKKKGGRTKESKNN